jgi:hypothetical protein
MLRLSGCDPKEVKPHIALRRGRDAQAAGEPFVLDVHIANVGAGADQSWHMPFAPKS